MLVEPRLGRWGLVLLLQPAARGDLRLDNKRCTMGEKVGLLFKGLTLKAGTGSPWESPTESAQQQIELSNEAVKRLEDAVRKGASKATPKIFIPDPMKHAGGTPGKPVHGG